MQTILKLLGGIYPPGDSAALAVNTNFSGLWLDPTGNRTHVDRISSKRSIHSTTDRFKKIFLTAQYTPIVLLFSYPSLALHYNDFRCSMMLIILKLSFNYACLEFRLPMVL